MLGDDDNSIESGNNVVCRVNSSGVLILLYTLKHAALADVKLLVGGLIRV